MPPYASVAHTFCSCKVAEARQSPTCLCHPFGQGISEQAMLDAAKPECISKHGAGTANSRWSGHCWFIFHVYLSKLSGYVTSACNFQLNQRSFLRQQQTGRRDVSDKFVSCWNSGSQHWCSAIYTGERGTKPPRLRDAPFGASSPWHSNTSNVLIIWQIL